MRRPYTRETAFTGEWPADNKPAAAAVYGAGQRDITEKIDADENAYFFKHEMKLYFNNERKGGN